jgi:hypothetical protein
LGSLKKRFQLKEKKQDKEETRPQKKARHPKKSVGNTHVMNEDGCDVDGDEEDIGEHLWLEPRDGDTLDGNGNLQGLVKHPAEEDSESNMDSDNEDEDIEEDEDEDEDDDKDGSDIMQYEFRKRSNSKAAV